MGGRWNGSSISPGHQRPLCRRAHTWSHEPVILAQMHERGGERYLSQLTTDESREHAPHYLASVEKR